MEPKTGVQMWNTIVEHKVQEWSQKLMPKSGAQWWNIWCKSRPKKWRVEPKNWTFPLSAVLYFLQNTSFSSLSAEVNLQTSTYAQVQTVQCMEDQPALFRWRPVYCVRGLPIPGWQVARLAATRATKCARLRQAKSTSKPSTHSWATEAASFKRVFKKAEKSKIFSHHPSHHSNGQKGNSV